MKWQYDKPFVTWLLGQSYAEEKGNKIIPFVSLGLVLYMYEAYRQGFKVRGS